MKFLKIFLFILFLGQFAQQLTGQSSYFEVGAELGISNYGGDMSVDGVGKALQTAYGSATVYSRYNFNPIISVKGAFTYLQVGADDANSENASFRNRDLSFHTNIFEASLTGEVNFWRYDPVYGNSIFVIYGMAGVGGFYFNPTTVFEGRRYRLQPLGTEGQGLEQYPDRDFYSLYQIAFPVGGGAKIKINQSLNLNIELNWRFTLTDYLDDLSTTYPNYNALQAERGQVAADLSHRKLGNEPGSLNDTQRGNPDVRDYYYSLHIGVSYNLASSYSQTGYNRKRRKSITSKCPTF